MPRRFRQGKPSPLTVTLSNNAPSVRTVTVRLDSSLDDGVTTSRAPAIPELMVEIQDTMTVSRRMRVSLYADTVGGAAFTIDQHHGAAVQAIRDNIAAKWDFQVTPLKAGRQRLYIAVDLLSESGETHLGTIVKAVDVQVDRWWRVKRWFAINIAPVLVGSILIPLFAFFGVRYFRRRDKGAVTD
jgi:hypothetical protein